jgi:hypothetical protein
MSYSQLSMNAAMILGGIAAFLGYQMKKRKVVGRGITSIYLYHICAAWGLRDISIKLLAYMVHWFELQVVIPKPNLSHAASNQSSAG